MSSMCSEKASFEKATLRKDLKGVGYLCRSLVEEHSGRRNGS